MGVGPGPQRDDRLGHRHGETAGELAGRTDRAGRGSRGGQGRHGETAGDIARTSADVEHVLDVTRRTVHEVKVGGHHGPVPLSDAKGAVLAAQCLEWALLLDGDAEAQDVGDVNRRLWRAEAEEWRTIAHALIKTRSIGGLHTQRASGGANTPVVTGA